MSEPRKLKIFIDGAWRESKGAGFMECYDPSTGAVIALAPRCTAGGSGRSRAGRPVRLAGLGRHTGQ